ncbi:MAG: hydrogen gas-evolving membrane-bound hydrogenase subunit E [Ilumatobacter sp.]|uniref:hydrogen gas-evolving membrane-bound hydrogenase subunit E n=1 Tax=Ilumatobacter sp. TaxID=1967498 RepID=UPI003C7642A2
MLLWLVLGAHVAGLAAILLVGRLGDRFDARAVFAVASVPAMCATVVSVSGFTRDTDLTTSVDWVEGLDIVLALRLDALSAILGLVVAGIGVLVFVYAAGYFGPSSKDLARFSATLSAFSASMIGLVWSDSIWSLFLFWELTSITSFLLVGHKHVEESVQRSARRALLITASGGLALLAGLLLVAGGDTGIALRDLEPTTGGAATLAGVLVLVAAATKSAQIPFHVWLPGAMAAPTPVSAYLHSATMVKAGVIAVALFGPVLGDTPAWQPLGIALGLGSMVWGAIGALRHVDAKLILAWGTISQLGLMITLLSTGSAKATFAGLSILVAHAIFKAALFMVVGEIDVRTGTRDVRELGGLRRSMPVAFWVCVVSGASMAGVPPLLGFPAKEAALEAALGEAGWLRLILLVGIVGGSVLTVAYTTRFVLAVFGPSISGNVTDVAPRRAPITVVTVALATASLVGFVALGWVGDGVRNAAILLDPDAEVYSLIRWPGLKTAFVLSLAIIAAGAPLGWRLTRRVNDVPRPRGADAADGIVDGVLSGARRVTGRVQHGSLPIYLMTAIVVASASAVPFAFAIDVSMLRWTDRAVVPALGALIVAGAVGTVRIPGRLGAALGLGSVGFGMAGIFVAQGAPDLALTQLLVETVVVVGFVIGLGHLSTNFPQVGYVWRTVRTVVAIGLGGAVSIGLAAAASRPSGTAPVAEFVDQAADTGGGNNVVNVILTDIRALDTFGEVVVLVAVAVGIIALSRSSRTGSDWDGDVADDGAGIGDVVPSVADEVAT